MSRLNNPGPTWCRCAEKRKEEKRKFEKKEKRKERKGKTNEWFKCITVMVANGDPPKQGGFWSCG